jgi:hypothetical protein
MPPREEPGVTTQPINQAIRAVEAPAFFDSIGHLLT